MYMSSNPLLCLYCNARILPADIVGCKWHMFKCTKHPAAELITAMKKIRVLSKREDDPCTYEEERDLLEARREDIEALADEALRDEA